ncbi:MAG: phosphatase PAP2 family protein [Candidatus Paceibacterota bacterium]
MLFLQNIDVALFWFFYNLSHHSAVLDAIGVFFAEYVTYVTAAILAIVFFWPNREQMRNRMTVIVSVAAALIARYVVKAGIVLAFPRPRPFVILSTVQPLISVSSWENLQSFPSGHTIFFFALATVLYCFNKKIGWWAFGAAALIGVARIYVGVHWPSDIIIGAILGILTGWIIHRWYKSSRFYV